MTGPREVIKLPDSQESKIETPPVLEKQPEPSEGTQDIQQTSTPTPAPLTEDKDRLIEAQGAVIQELSQKFETVAQRLERLEQPPEPVPPVEEQDKKFWQSPTVMIREEMDRAISPLRDHMATQGRKSEYQELKDKVAAQGPQYAEVIQKAGSYVDQLMQNQEPSETNIKAVIYGLRGAAAMGDLPGIQFDGQVETPNVPSPSVPTTPSAPSAQKVDMSQLPPHLRPSAPAMPQQQEQSVEVNLTENERRLAREYGMTPEEYIAWREMPSHEVAHSDFGIPKPEGS